MKNKIKNWIIHKLGGYTKEDRDNKPIKFSVQNIKLETINYDMYISDYDFHRYPKEYFEEFVKLELAKEIAKKLNPMWTLKELDSNGKKISLKIEIPSIYVRESENNEKES